MRVSPKKYIFISVNLKKEFQRKKDADRWTDGRTFSNLDGQTDSIRIVRFDW